VVVNKLGVSAGRHQLLCNFRSVHIVSVYEHFGWRTASGNKLNSWTEVPLYKKKDHLNRELIAAHLQAAREWGTLWTIISDSIHSLRKVSEQKYQVVNKKTSKTGHHTIGCKENQSAFPSLCCQYYSYLLHHCWTKTPKHRTSIYHSSQTEDVAMQSSMGSRGSSDTITGAWPRPH
jgi:hypothetical protein